MKTSQSDPTPHRGWWRVVRRPAFLALAGIAVPALSGCGEGSPRERSAPPVPVRVVEISPVSKEHKEQMRFTGVVRARTESHQGFRVAGKITERLVSAGDVVKKGQPLLRLDPADLDLALRAAGAEVDMARAVNTQAGLSEARAKKAFEFKGVSREVLEQAAAGAESSAARLHSAESQMAQAANRFTYTTLSAEADGVVMTTLGEPGQVVSPGQTVLVLAQRGPREAAVDIPEQLLESIRGKAAAARLYGGPTKTADAILREVSGAADPVSRTFQARYILTGESTRYPLGSTVTVIVTSMENAGQALTEIPVGALIDRGEGAAVWTVDPKTSVIQKRPVSIARLGFETAFIGEGLQPGDIVVSLGAHLLNAGQSVRPLGSPKGEATP